ncbi:MAG: hypothetical protein N3D20_02155 [Candidatus Pacearchaeota archaeon]|nr:hypothetical protein [Candidatus Pacearchaeota archaeon]
MIKRGYKLYLKGFAISEIFILIIATFAFCFMIGEIKFVSGQNGNHKPSSVKQDSATKNEPSSVNQDSATRRADSSNEQKNQGAEDKTKLNNPIGTSNGQGIHVTKIPREGETFSFRDNAARQLTIGQKKISIPENAQVKYEKGIYKVQVKNKESGKWEDYKEGGNDVTLTSEEFKAAQEAGLTSGAIEGRVFWKHLGEGLLWGATVFGTSFMIANAVGAKKGESLAISSALAAGVLAYKITLGIAEAKKIGQTALWGLTKAQVVGIGIGVAVAAIVFALMYKEEYKKKISFTCLPYEPPVGGKDCEKCNADKFKPCSEYRCRSLGQACQLLNKGTADEKCAWVNPKDVTSPIITAAEETLYPIGLRYAPLGAIRPGARGVKIVNDKTSTKCLAPFTPLKFGIRTNEPTQCKIDYEHPNSYENMSFYFGETNLYDYNHTQELKLPGPDVFDETKGETAPIIKNDGTMTFYVRCRDANGNYNVDEFVIEFCVDKGPDTTPPIIQDSSIGTNNYVSYKVDNVPIEIYVNEPAECRWSKESKPYENMENSMNCARTAREINAIMSYTCAGNLSGIKDKENNKFYFRCKDQPEKPENERNVMVQSYELNLKGTIPLTIESIGPNGIITGATSIVDVDLEVITGDGAEEGKAICYFSPTENERDFVQMFETNSYKHKQRLSLASGVYRYYVTCVDAGGNSAKNSTMFEIFVDKDAPKVTRVYKEEGTGIKITTNENAECRYSLSDCNFNIVEGIPLVYSNPNIKWIQYVEWKPNVIYYIKCIDEYGNEPNPNECTIEIKASEIGKKKIL